MAALCSTENFQIHWFSIAQSFLAVVMALLQMESQNYTLLRDSLSIICKVKGDFTGGQRFDPAHSHQQLHSSSYQGIQVMQVKKQQRGWLSLTLYWNVNQQIKPFPFLTFFLSRQIYLSSSFSFVKPNIHLFFFLCHIKHTILPFLPPL